MRKYHDLLRSNTLHKPAIQEPADDQKDVEHHVQAKLPIGCDLVFAISHLLTEMLLETGIGIERTEDVGVVRFHYGGHAHDQAPAYGLAVGLDGISDSDLVFIVLVDVRGGIDDLLLVHDIRLLCGRLFGKILCHLVQSSSPLNAQADLGCW